jgi:hypothetical protein
MSLSEILCKLTPKTQNYAGSGATGSSDLTWQDIVHAMQGVDPGKTAFMLCVYGSDTQACHQFWAGLFMSAMELPTVRIWSSNRRHDGYHGAVKALSRLAVLEWTQGRDTWTHQRRANEIGVSRGTWNRKYRDIYQRIVDIPGYWQEEVERLLRQRLR